jgi:hypothetical protein
MRKRTVFLCGSVLIGLSATASQLYTNTWINKEGVSVVKNWNDSSNWAVEYGENTPPPASSLPGENSFVKLQQSASISLLPGDSYTIGRTYFLAGTFQKTLNVEIPYGATLSLNDGASLGAPNTWQDGSIDNKVKIDVNGGEFKVLDGIVQMRPLMTAQTSKGYNHILVRNGGKVSMWGDSIIRMWGGSSEDSQGKGLYTNIIDVLEGSTLELNENATITMGSDINRSAVHDRPAYYGGGWVNVKGSGSSIVAKDPTFEAPFYMAIHDNAGVGAYLNVTDNGKVDLGGKALFIMSHNTNIIRVASGGVISNFIYRVEDGANDNPCYHNMIDIDGGKVFMDACQFITKDLSDGIRARATFRIHGPDSIFDTAVWKMNPSENGYSFNKVPPFFADFRLTGNTLRDSEFAVRPIRTRTFVYNSGGGNNKYVIGIYRLSPDGGFQLTHKDSFELVCRYHDSQGNYITGDTYGGVIGEEMWQTNAVVKCEDRWKKYTGYQYAYIFEVSPKAEAQISDGVRLQQPRPRAWFKLPSFTEKELESDNTRRISVHLDLVASENGTLDLDSIVENMRVLGKQDAYKDNSVEGYNVRVDIPLSKLSAGANSDKIIMDFVSCDTYSQAYGSQPMTTNALIRAVTCQRVPEYNFTLMFLK